MCKMIEQIRIGKTGCSLCDCSALDRFGPDPQITFPARYFWKYRTTRSERNSHSITCQDRHYFLHHGRQKRNGHDTALSNPDSAVWPTEKVLSCVVISRKVPQAFEKTARAKASQHFADGLAGI